MVCGLWVSMQQHDTRRTGWPDPAKIPGSCRNPSGSNSFTAATGCCFRAGSDASVVRRTQARLGAQNQPTVHYSAYFTVPTYFTFLLFAIFGKLMETLTKFGWGRWLLLQYPRVFSYGLFSKEGPTEQQMAETSFEMKFIGHGYSKGDACTDFSYTYLVPQCIAVCTTRTSCSSASHTCTACFHFCNVGQTQLETKLTTCGYSKGDACIVFGLKCTWSNPMARGCLHDMHSLKWDSEIRSSVAAVHSVEMPF